MVSRLVSRCEYHTRCHLISLWQVCTYLRISQVLLKYWSYFLTYMFRIGIDWWLSGHKYRQKQQWWAMPSLPPSFGRNNAIFSQQAHYLWHNYWGCICRRCSHWSMYWQSCSVYIYCLTWYLSFKAIGFYGALSVRLLACHSLWSMLIDWSQRRLAIAKIFVGLSVLVIFLVAAAELVRTVVHFAFKVIPMIRLVPFDFRHGSALILEYVDKRMCKRSHGQDKGLSECLQILLRRAVFNFCAEFRVLGKIQSHDRKCPTV